MELHGLQLSRTTWVTAVMNKVRCDLILSKKTEKKKTLTFYNFSLFWAVRHWLLLKTNKKTPTQNNTTAVNTLLNSILFSLHTAGPPGSRCYFLFHAPQQKMKRATSSPNLGILGKFIWGSINFLFINMVPEFSGCLWSGDLLVLLFGRDWDFLTAWS